ncbi:uncharacterized protein TNCV_3231071 [Trichonephila clavipes]|nr:uncharacterized protein TNCV_3231071 [Trichonephila clavipes]
MKIGNNGNLVLGPSDESTPCLMIVLMNCQTKLRINHLAAVKSVAILESNANFNFYTWKKTLFISVRLVAEALDLPRSTVQKIMRNILRYHPYKLQLVQELLPHDFETRHLFSLLFLVRLEVDPERPWNILWTDEAHFHLDGSVNTHNCRIWESDNPHSTLQVPLHSPKVTVWCGFSTSFILGPYFFEELGAGGPVTCSITGQRYASLLRYKIIPDLQARPCLSRIIFMQDGAPPHITRCVKDVLKHHFTEERVISRQFLHLRPP